MIALTKLRLINVLMVLFAITTLVNGQYFSPHYSSYARNGKRSYLAKLVQFRPTSSSATSAQLEAASNENKNGKSSDITLIAGDSAKNIQQKPLSNFYQTDKLSFRKSFNKFGKRNEAQEAALKEIIADDSELSEYLLQIELTNLLENYLNAGVTSNREKKRRIAELIQLLSNDQEESANDE